MANAWRWSINMSKLRTVAAKLRAEPFKELFESWGDAYAQFIQKRFDRLSRGGGEWPPLKPATIRAKRRAGFGGTARLILVMTRFLRRHLDPWLSRTSFKVTPNGVNVAFGKSARHPRAHVPVSTLALWHHEGAGRLPVRKIIVNADMATINKMKALGLRAIDRFWARRMTV